jgi:hypothetical protein
MTENQSPQLGFLQEFEYSKTPVLAGISPLGEMIAIKPICENLGIDRKWQQDKIKSDPYLNSVGGMCKMVSKDGKKYDMYCLPPAAFNKWLFSLTATEKMNVGIWEEYKQGLVIYILTMLKISLDKIQSMAQTNEDMKRVRSLYIRKGDLKRELGELNEAVKKTKADILSAQREIDEILSLNPNQLRLEI